MCCYIGRVPGCRVRLRPLPCGYERRRRSVLWHQRMPDQRTMLSHLRKHSRLLLVSARSSDAARSRHVIFSIVVRLIFDKFTYFILLFHFVCHPGILMDAQSKSSWRVFEKFFKIFFDEIICGELDNYQYISLQIFCHVSCTSNKSKL